MAGVLLGTWRARVPTETGQGGSVFRISVHAGIFQRSGQRGDAMTKTAMRAVTLLIIVALILPLNVIPPPAAAQDGAKPLFSEGELEQIVAPIALYPDSLLSQILMASTYPLEIVQADRWVKQNKNLRGDALTAALEKQQWDPSVKSLVNFPEVLDMMNQKLDWTQKLGNAFLAQQKDVLDTVQALRKKADAEGYLKTTKEQKVVVQKETQTIVIESVSPTVVYVPAYNPTVVYGVWAYPAYPPYYYYPPGYAAGAAAFGFAAGVAVGAAWGYAWGGCNWNSGHVDVNVNRNIDVNRNINRQAYAKQYQGGTGNWQHNPQHRKGVAYPNQATAQRYNRASTNQAIRSRENYRGRAQAGRQEIARGGADQFKGRQGTGQRGDAFSGMDRSGRTTRDFSNRGSSSRQGMSSFGRGGGFGGGAPRGGGFGGRGGGRR